MFFQIGCAYWGIPKIHPIIPKPDLIIEAENLETSIFDGLCGCVEDT